MAAAAGSRLASITSRSTEFQLGIDKDQMKFVSPADAYLALRMSGNATETAYI